MNVKRKLPMTNFEAQPPYPEPRNSWPNSASEAPSGQTRNNELINEVTRKLPRTKISRPPPPTLGREISAPIWPRKPLLDKRGKGDMDTPLGSEKCCKVPQIGLGSPSRTNEARVT